MRNTPKIVLLVESSKKYDRDLLRGIAKYSQMHGPWDFYTPSSFKIEKLGNDILSNIKNLQPDGIILREQNYDLNDFLCLNIPVFVSPVKSYSVSSDYKILSDWSAIAKMGTEYLLGLRLRNFAYCGFYEIPWSIDHAKAFEKEIANAGYTTFIYQHPKSKNNRKWENEQLILEKWLKDLPKPIAIMTCCDDRSLQITEVCKRAKIRVPEEIAILGVDNDEAICEPSYPPLSSIALNAERTGFEVAELLDKIINGQKMPPQNLLVKPLNVVVRQSTTFAAIDDPFVIDALKFIHENHKRLIQVNEVADAVKLTRRNLEKRFQKQLQSSITSQIKYTRIQNIANMLIETDHSILRIARTFGFTGVDHISRYFSSEKGMSPRKFRQKYKHV